MEGAAPEDAVLRLLDDRQPDGFPAQVDSRFAAKQKSIPRILGKADSPPAWRLRGGIR